MRSTYSQIFKYSAYRGNSLEVSLRKVAKEAVRRYKMKYGITKRKVKTYTS